MFRGEPINPTESRAALHVALRQRPGDAVGGAAIERLVLQERARVLAFATRVRDGGVRGSGGAAFRTVDQHRHRRLRSRAGDGGRGAAAVRRGRAAGRLRLQRRRLHAGRPAATTSDPRTHAVHRRLQDLHDPGNDGECRQRACLARGAARRSGDPGAFRRRVGQRAGHGRVRHPSGPPLRDVGLGGRSLFDLVVDRRVAGDRRSARRISRPSSAAPATSIGISPARPGRRTCRC